MVEYGNYIEFLPIYKTDDNDHHHEQDPSLEFDFELMYTPTPDEGEDIDHTKIQIVQQTVKFDKQWLLGGDEKQILANVYDFLEWIQVPCYTDVVATLHSNLLYLKEDSVSLHVEKVKVGIEVMV